MASVGLDSRVRRLVAGCAVSAIGTGFVLPIVLIYLHRVRHIPLTTTGLLMTIPGIVGLAAVPLAGTLCDRIGARRVVAGSLLLLTAAEVWMAFVNSPGWAAAALFVRGAAMGPIYTAFNTMLASLAHGEGQQRAFAINFTALNAAIGIGGVIGSAIINVHHALTFQLMFFGDAIASGLAALVILTVRVEAATPAAAETDEAPKAGYRAVLRVPELRRLIVISLLLALCGYAALDAGLPAYANVVAGVSPRVVALSLASNTLTIVVLQLVVLRSLRGRRRTQALAAAGLVWCASWALFGTSALPSAEAARAGVVVAFCALFGFGECFMAPSLSPLVISLADEQVRGRANALSGGMFSLAFVVSPAISSGLIAAGLGGLWIALLCAGCLAIAVMVTRLGRRLTPEQDIAANPEPEPVEVGTVP